MICGHLHKTYVYTEMISKKKNKFHNSKSIVSMKSKWALWYFFSLKLYRNKKYIIVIFENLLNTGISNHSKFVIYKKFFLHSSIMYNITEKGAMTSIDF